MPLKKHGLWRQELGAAEANVSRSYVLVDELSFDTTQVNRILAGAAWIWEAGDGIQVLVSSSSFIAIR
tara:strand:+ start:580 stop:783 length:204 start_codon:yes stop_codon:yes gene_type:complete